MRDQFDQLAAKNVVVFGASLEGSESHQKFRTLLRLPFPLLADTGHKMASDYGVFKHYAEGDQSFDYAGRSLFLVGPDGKVVFANPNFKMTDAEWRALFAAVAALPADAANKKGKQEKSIPTKDTKSTKERIK